MKDNNNNDNKKNKPSASLLDSGRSQELGWVGGQDSCDGCFRPTWWFLLQSYICFRSTCQILHFKNLIMQNMFLFCKDTNCFAFSFKSLVFSILYVRSQKTSQNFHQVIGFCSFCIKRERRRFPFLNCSFRDKNIHQLG